MRNPLGQEPRILQRREDVQTQSHWMKTEETMHQKAYVWPEGVRRSGTCLSMVELRQK